MDQKPDLPQPMPTEDTNLSFLDPGKFPKKYVFNGVAAYEKFIEEHPEYNKLTPRYYRGLGSISDTDMEDMREFKIVEDQYIQSKFRYLFKPF